MELTRTKKGRFGELFPKPQNPQDIVPHAYSVAGANHPASPVPEQKRLLVVFTAEVLLPWIEDKDFWESCQGGLT